MIMELARPKSESTQCSDPRGLKEAVLSSFRGSASDVAVTLEGYTEQDWRATLVWLDVSGMALYLLDRVKWLGVEECIPAAIRTGLEGRLKRNQERTTALLHEAGAVSRAFEKAGVWFAVMKGISLTPDSVPDPALRWQTDIDLLISETDCLRATEILQGMGYMLHALSGQTLEFRSGILGKPDLANLYCADMQRSVELHWICRREGIKDRLTRIQFRAFAGVTLPVLSSADILVHQALHLMKHLCGEHTRASWVLEFWRHIRLRQQDDGFWHEVRTIAAEEPNADLAMGISVWVAMNMFGAVPCVASKCWPADRIPGGVQMWLQIYARELLLSDSFGTKLYLLLCGQLPGVADATATRRALFPIFLPARITESIPGESLVNRLGRYRIEGGHIWRRLRFHVIEGLRYRKESLHWARRMSKVTQP